MDAIRNLSTPMRIAIGGGIAAVLLVIVMTMMLSGGGSTQVYKDTDARKVAAAQWKLKSYGVTPTLKGQEGSVMTLEVEESKKDEAIAALNPNSIMGQLKSKGPKDTCKEPGALSGNRVFDTFELCKKKLKSEGFLMKAPGVLQASVELDTQKNDGLTGARELTTVAVQLFKDAKTTNINARALAVTLASMTGAAPEHITIFDTDTGELLWGDNGSATATGATMDGKCVMPPDGSSDITLKEEFLSCQLEQKLTRKIEELVGPERAKVFVGFTLNAEARSVSIDEIRKGAVATETISPDTTERQYQPGSRKTNLAASAGYIKQLRLGATLDSRYVEPHMENTVRSLLKQYVDAGRGDPVPTVTATKFNKDASPSPSDSSASTGGGASGTPSDTSLDTSTATTGKNSIPGALLAAGFVLVVGLGAAVALLWRRAARLSEERRRFEAEFQGEQQLFANFAQDNPELVAQQLEAMLGQPARRDPVPNR